MFKENTNQQKNNDLLKYFYFYERFPEFRMDKYWN